VGKFAASINDLKTTNAPASGGFIPDQGSALGPTLGIAPTPPLYIGSRYCARHGAVSPRCCGLELLLASRRKSTQHSLSAATGWLSAFAINSRLHDEANCKRTLQADIVCS